ncbi:hypothetical protein AC233_00130 [Burkholderia sp. HB1]|nr:hypothetical protein AC233_00130 [Burkholderia sp. HB1]
MTNLDLSFDLHFETRPALRWWPWVGSQYASSPVRTLVLGESIYEWTKTPREQGIFRSRYARPDALRVTHLNHALQFKRNSRYVRNIERAVLCSAKPTNDHKLAFWSSVAYHNLVLDPLRSLKHRPSQRQFRAGWEEVLDLLNPLAVRQILVYGVGSVDALKEVAAQRELPCRIEKIPQNINRCYPRAGALTTPCGEIQLLFVLHPSRPFSWKPWSGVIQERLSLSVAV